MEGLGFGVFVLLLVLRFSAARALKLEALQALSFEGFRAYRVQGL